MSHTPGPWAVSGQLIVGPPEPYPNPKAQPMGRKIAEICWNYDGDRGATGDLPWSTAKHNGNLIAAAPELLEAACKLQMVVEEWIQSHDEGNGPSPADWAKEILEFSRAAIAKATIDESETARTTKFFNDRHDARVAAGNQSLFKEGN